MNFEGAQWVFKKASYTLFQLATRRNNIGSTLREVKEFCSRIIVVDDGSRDDTAAEAEAGGARVVFHGRSRGVGAALKTGLKEALKLSHVEYVVTLDADGQHDPSDIPRLLKPLIEGKADMVIGSRLLTEPSSMPRHRLLANKLLSWLTTKACGLKVSDSQSGFRAYNRRAVETLLNGFRENYSWASSVVIESARRGLKVAEVPIEAIYFKGSSTGAGLRVMLRILFFLLSEVFLQGFR